MSTKQTESKPSTALFGKTRRAVLSLLYGRADEEFYIRYILRSVSVGHRSVQRELKRLAEAGILRRTARGRQVYYQANRDSPIFPELKSLITKTAGVGDILLNALAPLAERIKIAFIFGSVARGEENPEGTDPEIGKDPVFWILELILQKISCKSLLFVYKIQDVIL